MCLNNKLDVDIIIEGINRHADKGMAKYAEYMSYLFKVNALFYIYSLI